jgi:hypothetical protein
MQRFLFGRRIILRETKMASRDLLLNFFDKPHSPKEAALF